MVVAMDMSSLKAVTRMDSICFADRCTVSVRDSMIVFGVGLVETSATNTSFAWVLGAFRTPIQETP